MTSSTFTEKPAVQTVWDDADFVAGWNRTYGLDMSRAISRSKLAFPLIEERIGLTAKQGFAGLTLADIGSGNGNLIRHFSSKPFRHWYGLEPGKAVMATAKGSLGDMSDRVTLIECSATQPLPLEIKADVATSLFVIEEIPAGELTAYFDTVRKVLNPNGILCLFSNHPAYALMADYRANILHQPNTKLRNQKGYFDMGGAFFQLSKLNEEGGEPKQPTYYQKPISFILNSLVSAGLHLSHIEEIPDGEPTLEGHRSHQPKSGDTPRFLYLEAKLA